MKSLVTVVSAFLENRSSRINLLALFRLVLVFAVLVTIFSVLFHIIMEREGQHHTWMTGFYWTLTVMSTLGFGDITFNSDLGRFFSIVVLVTGVVFLLVLLPFTFIEFFYAPWMKAQAESRSPRQLPANTSRHVLLTLHGPVTNILVRMLEKHHYPYYMLVPTVAEALEMQEKNQPVVIGELSDPETYRRLRIENAAMVVTTRSDIINTNVTFSVREISDNIPVIASARSPAARDALELAGVTHILRLEEMMGSALSRRVIGSGSSAHIIGKMDDLVIAEAGATGTSLIGKTLAESGLKSQSGVTVVGFWNRGRFEPAEPDMKFGEHTFFILGGTKEQIDSYNQAYANAGEEESDSEKTSVVIIGGGRVGRATAKELDKRGVTWKMIEKLQERVQFPNRTIVGDGSDFDLLVEAGLHDASAVIITTHDDDTNIFLTIFYRKLRKSIQIISRCVHDESVSRLHRAGADLVLSYASMSANTIFNFLRGNDMLLLAEGVSVFSSEIPQQLSGKTVAESQIRSQTGCSIIAVECDGKREINPEHDVVLPPGGELFLIGSLEAEEKFFKSYLAR